MSLLSLVFLLNGLSVPAIEIDSNDLSEPLRVAQQLEISDQNHCLQITESVLKSSDNKPSEITPRNYQQNGRIRDRLQLRSAKQQVQALLIQGSCFANQQQYNDAVESWLQAEQLADQQQFLTLQAISLYRLIVAYGLELNKPILAHHAWQKLMVLQQDSNLKIDDFPIYSALLNTAIAIHRQLPEIAKDMLSQANTLLISAPNSPLNLWADMLHGDLLAISHQEEQSLLTYNALLAVAEKSQQNTLALQLNVRISRLFARNRELSNAIQYAEQAVELAQRLGNQSWQADAIIELAQLKRENRETHLALALLLNAADVYRFNAHPLDFARLNLEIGKTYQQLRRFDEAQAYLTAAYELFRRQQEVYYERVSLLALAELYLKQNRPMQSIVLLEQMLNTPTPEQKTLEPEIYRLLSTAYEENEQYDRALLNYKLFANSRTESQNQISEQQSDFFANYTQMIQSQQLKELENKKNQLTDELSWYFRVGLIAAGLMTVLGGALLWHMRKLRETRQVALQQNHLLNYDPLTGMGTSHLLMSDLEDFAFSLSNNDRQPARVMLLFNAPGLNNLECTIGIKKAQSVLRQIAHSVRQRIPDSSQFYILPDRLLLCTIPENELTDSAELIVRLENRLGIIMRKYGLNERVICGKVQYPFLNKSINALKPLQTLEICGIALAAAKQISDKLCKNVWLELYSIDCQQAAFFNGELRARTIDAITKGLVKVSCSEPIQVDWWALVAKK